MGPKRFNSSPVTKFIQTTNSNKTSTETQFALNGLTNKPTTVSPAQGRSADGRGSCSKCRITYPAVEGQRLACPLCEANKQIDRLRNEIQKQANAADIVRRDKQRLERVVDEESFMREAMTELEGEDLAVVKAVLYELRDNDGGIAVKPAIREVEFRGSRGGRGVRHEVSGFLIQRRKPKVDVEVFHATSIGGRSLALAYSEAMKVVGQVEAQKMLLRAGSSLLAPKEDA